MANDFIQYRRTQIAEMRPWKFGDDMEGVSISKPDSENGSPRDGDMIARNPKNHADQWLVAAQYFADNFEPMERRSPPPAVEGGWRFKRGDYVRKVVGSKWNGRVVGFYTTELTQRGYAVESMYEIGSVQIYPEKALELFSVAPTPPAGEKP